LGVIGAVVGGWIFSSRSGGRSGLNLYSLAVSPWIGAVVLLVVYHADSLNDLGVAAPMFQNRRDRSERRPGGEIHPVRGVKDVPVLTTQQVYAGSDDQNSE
jgi:hypothetical protein